MSESFQTSAPDLFVAEEAVCGGFSHYRILLPRHSERVEVVSRRCLLLSPFLSNPNHESTYPSTPLSSLPLSTETCSSASTRVPIFLGFIVPAQHPG